MLATFVAGLAFLASLTSAATVPRYLRPVPVSPKQAYANTNTSVGLPFFNTTDYQHGPSCEHGPDSRQCWGAYDVNTNWYTDTPYTGVTREYWLVAENITMCPDGWCQQVLTFNRSIPGPTIFADWGDEVIVHVTNLMQDNGTSIHWHGLRQYHNNEFDGVPGVTQCPIAPGQTYTYKWRATQYGTSWYHSHYSFQYSAGLQGAIVINGPATSNYDEDLGTIMLQDWSHISPFNEWWWDRPKTGPPNQASSLINGTNAYDCATSNNLTSFQPDQQCQGKGEIGQRLELVFTEGKKYRIRLINSGMYSHFRFAIDGHQITVVAMDFVPLQPYTTDSLVISMGQRYDIIVEANATPGNYWLRPIWQRTCCDNDAWNNTLGIVRYDSFANSTALPTTTNPATDYPQVCEDEPYYKLVPQVALDVPPPPQLSLLNLNYSFVPMPAGFLFTLNNSYIWTNFSAPTNLLIAEKQTDWPNTFYTPTKGFTDYDSVPLAYADQWVYFAIQDISHRNRSHPMHLHGHDYFVIGQGFGRLGANTTLHLQNPPRRDVASVPLNGYMIMAFKTDNPGSWLMHCHISPHSSEGLGLQFVERENEIMATYTDQQNLQDTCSNWWKYWTADKDFVQEDSGI